MTEATLEAYRPHAQWESAALLVLAIWTVANLLVGVLFDLNTDPRFINVPIHQPPLSTRGIRSSPVDAQALASSLKQSCKRRLQRADGLEDLVGELSPELLKPPSYKVQLRSL